MKTELVDVSPTRKEIKIEIEPAVVRKTYDRISDRYAKQASVPGFRRGHAPRSVVRARFKSEIRGEVLRELVPDAINDAIDEHELALIGEPDVHLDNTDAIDRFGEEPISVHVNVEVLPKVELGKYKGLAAVRRVRPAHEADVDRMIEGLREASAALQPVEDRGAELGDTITVNFHGKFLAGIPEADSVAVAGWTLDGSEAPADFPAPVPAAGSQAVESAAPDGRNPAGPARLAARSAGANRAGPLEQGASEPGAIGSEPAGFAVRDLALELAAPRPVAHEKIGTARD